MFAGPNYKYIHKELKKASVTLIFFTTNALKNAHLR